MPVRGTHYERAAVYPVGPLEDRCWDDFVRGHPRSSVFHTHAWLEALRRAHGYEPVVYTTSPPGAALENGWVFCRVNSWLTGRRLVSLPFSDHCEPLVDNPEDLQAILAEVEGDVLQDNLKYFEIRPRHAIETTSSLSHSTYFYYFHELDLRPDLDILFRNCHKDSTQRKILRAEREGLTYEEGRSDTLLNDFYELLLLTRRRHQIPPQPKEWFRILADCFGEALKIRIAFKNDQPAAAILTLRHKNTLVYKYGASDSRFHKLGAMHLVFWRAIQEGNRDGLHTFDLGRSHPWNTGLAAFKDRWGSERTTVTYSRYARSPRFDFAPDGTWSERLAKGIVARLPCWMLRAVGELLYKHVG